MIAHDVAKLQFKPDATRRTVSDSQFATAFEVVDPHVVTLDVLPVLVQMREEILGFGRNDLMVKQWVDLTLPFHVRLTGKNEHLYRFQIRRHSECHQCQAEREEQESFHDVPEGYRLAKSRQVEIWPFCFVT